MTTHTLRWRGGWARAVPWRGQPHVALLTLGTMPPPTAGVVERCLARLRAEGYTSVVTGALNPADSMAFVDAGFAARERLHLLAHDMRTLPPIAGLTRRARHSDHPALLALDATAFDDFWHLDERGLLDALRATPATRFRVGEADGRLVAYAISGRAGTHGYLQRVAVHPEARGRGWGRELVADALHWLARHGVTRTLVNTQLDNEDALQLYAGCGFKQLPVGLCVFGRSL